MRIATQREIRRGIAPLEFVMALPLLMLTAMVIWKVGDGALKKTQTNIQARRDAAVPKTPPGPEAAPLPDTPILRIALDPKDGTYGLVEQHAVGQVRLRPVLPITAPISGREVILTGSWDSRSVEFSSRSNTDLYDPRVARLIAAGALPSFIGEFDPNHFSSDQAQQMSLKLAERMLLASNQDLAQAKEAFDNVSEWKKNPGAALLKLAGNELKLVKDLPKLGQAFSELKKAKDGFEDLRKMVERITNIQDPVPDE